VEDAPFGWKYPDTDGAGLYYQSRAQPLNMLGVGESLKDVAGSALFGEDGDRHNIARPGLQYLLHRVPNSLACGVVDVALDNPDFVGGETVVYRCAEDDSEDIGHLGKISDTGSVSDVLDVHGRIEACVFGSQCGKECQASRSGKLGVDRTSYGWDAVSPENLKRGRRRGRYCTVGEMEGTSTDSHRRSVDSSISEGAKIIQGKGCAEDIGESVPRSGLVQLDGLGRFSVHGRLRRDESAQCIHDKLPGLL
jgi:hypothetical protein